MSVWQLKLCDPLVTRRPYLSVLKIKDKELIIKRYINSPSLLYFTLLLLLEEKVEYPRY